MDVTVKGLFWLLEECRASPAFEQIILIGGDAALGHFFYPHALPVTEQQKHSAYPGCYALSKVLEEVMLEQYFIQYDLSGCCLRAPWIMEKDDFKYSLSFGEDVFGGPRWCDLVGAQRADEYVKSGAVPLMLDPEGSRCSATSSTSATWWTRSCSHSIIPRPTSRLSTFAWTSRWITGSGGLPETDAEDFRRLRSKLHSGPPGWITPKRNSCWAGGRLST